MLFITWHFLTHWSELILSSSWGCALGLYISSSSSSSSSSSLSMLLLSGRGGVVAGGVREGWGDPTQLTMPGSSRPFWAGSSGSIPSSKLLWAGAVWLFLTVPVFWGVLLPLLLVLRPSIQIIIKRDDVGDLLSPAALLPQPWIWAGWRWKWSEQNL